MPETLDIELYRNDSKVWVVTVTHDHIYGDDDDTAFDLTGYTYLAEVRRTPNSQDVVIPIVVDNSDESNGNLTLIINSQYTDDLETDLPFGTGHWDVQVASPASTPIVTTTHAGLVTYGLDISR